jgi:drug/metabolite transporter (DMT)-like permease
VNGLALGLVLLAAVGHASWNLLARRADEKLPFLWCTTLVTSVVFAPLGIWLLATQEVAPTGWVVVAISAGLEAFYYWTLSQAYRYGDLSLVYPLARGSAPILVPLLAAIFLGEHLSVLAAGGIALVAAGILTIHLPVGVWSGGWSGPHGIAATLGQLGTRYALLTGLVIATYSSLDKRGVALVPPLLYAYLLFVGLTAALVPLVRPQWDAVVREWDQHRLSIVVVGLLTPTSYGLVLFALTLAPVSYVAAAREVSVVLAAILGTVVLRESYGRQRLLGSLAITAGLALLVVG